MSRAHLCDGKLSNSTLLGEKKGWKSSLPHPSVPPVSSSQTSSLLQVGLRHRLLWEGSPHSNIRHEGTGDTTLAVREKEKWQKTKLQAKTSHQQGLPLGPGNLEQTIYIDRRRVCSSYPAVCWSRLYYCQSSCTHLFQVQRPCSGGLKLVLVVGYSMGSSKCCRSEHWGFLFVCFLFVRSLFRGKTDIKHLSAHYWYLSYAWY